MKTTKALKEKAVTVMLTKEAAHEVRGAEAWSKAVPKKRKERSKIGLEVIVVSKKEKANYANVLIQVKADLELKDLGNSVNRIRRSLMLKLKKSNEKTAKKFLGRKNPSAAGLSEGQTAGGNYRVQGYR